jgi:DNA-binding XRE family transcriptional regulator
MSATANRAIAPIIATFREGTSPMPGATSAAAIGRRLQGLRKGRGETPAQFARAIGLAAPQLTALERGDKKLTPSQAANISKVLGVPTEYLLEGA